MPVNIPASPAPEWQLSCWYIGSYRLLTIGGQNAEVKNATAANAAATLCTAGGPTKFGGSCY